MKSGLNANLTVKNRMNLMLDNLLALLEEETGLYGLMLSLTQSEKDAVINSNLDEMNKIAEEKDTLFFKIQTVEGQRQDVVKELAESMEWSPHDLTLGKLSQLVKEPYSSRLKERRSNLLALVQSIRDINSSNRELINHSLELVRSSFSFLNNATAHKTVYHSTGKMLDANQSGRVLSGEL